MLSSTMQASSIRAYPADPSADFARQQAIRARIRHPHGEWTPIPESEIEQAIPTRFEAMARRYPDRLAIKRDGRETTYAELNAQANHIAHAILNRLGAGPERAPEPVALLAEKDAPVMAAMLGVQKAGKFYVNLDPETPLERARFILADTQTRLLIADAQKYDMAAKLAGQDISLLSIENALGGNGLGDEDNPNVAIAPDAYAYLVYTSGTTGAPKGVIETHRNVMHFVYAATNSHRFCAEDRFTILPSLAFSGIATNFYSALLNGASLFPFDLQRAGLGAMIEWLRYEEATILTTTSPRLHDVEAHLPGTGYLPQVRLVYCGSERTFPQATAAFRRIFSPPCIQRVGYGSSEVKLISCYYIAHDLPEIGEAVPIGYPVSPHVQVRIVDEQGNDAPSGQSGQIVVRSRFVSPGYWRRPELTAERFATDPNDETHRLYFTGDQGTVDEEGCLYFLGRRDFQVKIDGHRIELGEVESAMLTMPDVRMAAVVKHQLASGDARLVAYYAPEASPGEPPGASVAELRRELSATLPPYMLPAVFVRLDRFPLTQSGKVDRMALPPPPDTRPALDIPYAAPRTHLERELAALWSQVIGVEGIGIHDPFLELGGSSLQALRITARVAETYAVDLTPEHLLAAVNVAEMAALLVRKIADTLPAQTVSRLLAESEAPPHVSSGGLSERNIRQSARS